MTPAALQRLQPTTNCNYQPFACASGTDICNWVDANSIEAVFDYAIATGDNYNGWTTELANQSACWFENGMGFTNINPAGDTPGNAWNSCGTLPASLGGDKCAWGYNDDAMWWATAFIRIYDYNHDLRFLHYAEKIFAQVATYWDNEAYTQACGGGVPWRTSPPIYGAGDGIGAEPPPGKSTSQEVNSITNELFLETAVRLHLRTCQQGTEPWCHDPGVPTALNATLGPSSLHYLDYANLEYAWLKKTFLNPSNLTKDLLIQDQIASAAPGGGVTCGAFQGGPYTYNNGVILGALVDMAEAEARWLGSTAAPCNPSEYLDLAYNMANNIAGGHTLLTIPSPNAGGALVLYENQCTPSGFCDDSRAPFKGIFMQYLGRVNDWSLDLTQVSAGAKSACTSPVSSMYGKPGQFTSFIVNNAVSIVSSNSCAYCANSNHVCTSNWPSDWRGSFDGFEPSNHQPARLRAACS